MTDKEFIIYCAMKAFKVLFILAMVLCISIPVLIYIISTVTTWIFLPLAGVWTWCSGWVYCKLIDRFA